MRKNIKLLVICLFMSGFCVGLSAGENISRSDLSEIVVLGFRSDCTGSTACPDDDEVTLNDCSGETQANCTASANNCSGSSVTTCECASWTSWCSSGGGSGTCGAGHQTFCVWLGGMSQACWLGSSRNPCTDQDCS